MWKIILLAILTLILIAAVFFWIKYSPLIKPNKLTSENKIPGKILGDIAQRPVNNFFNQTKDSLQETSQNLINNIKNQAYNQTQSTVNTVFDKSNPETVTVNILAVSKPPPDSFKIDFLTDSNLKLNLKLGTKYYLQFKNIPQDYCLYIADNKYQIIDTKIVELQFNSAGTYPIRLNSCEVNDKNLGELIVQ